MIIKGDCLEELKKLSDNSVDAVVTDPPYGLSFMGKKWDYDVPSAEIWKECLRVIKPGGYLLAFAGTRTQHRMAVRIEDAGFEIRDMIAWIYGSGFPKSLNIGKAVDKLQGNERESVVYKYQNRIPNGRSGLGLSGNDNTQIRTQDGDTKGTSEWEGWGTALKPALEPITVARKPLSEKTVAQNVLKYGTGGINIDGCRVEIPKCDKGGLRKGNYIFNCEATSYKMRDDGDPYRKDQHPQGRFPANLIHDGSDEVVGLFPESKSTSNIHNNKSADNIFKTTKDYTTGGHDDSGSAARFFYCAKASKSERNRGLYGFEDKNASHYGRDEFIENPYQRHENMQKNFHPTVKPIALMEYLVKLVSKEGHTVLDPFTGSGTTGIACKNLNRNFIGIERDAEYVKIAEARINA